MKVRRSRGPRSRSGNVLIVSLIVVIALMGISAAAMTVSLRSSGERNFASDREKALFVANSGVAHAVVSLTAGNEGDIGSPDDRVAFAQGRYWADVVDNDDGTFTVTSTGSVRGAELAVQAVLGQPPGGIYANAVFAGNTSGDPLYTMELGGTGSQADEIGGDIFSGGDVSLVGDATVSGTVRAAGTISGTSGEGGVVQPVPDLDAADYENTADFDVQALFAGATRVSDNAGGTAWQVPENNPAHIFRMNPSDRRTEYLGTEKNDYFLEDPYEPVEADSGQDGGSDAFRISLAGVDGEPGPDGNHKVYYIDGNLWIHNKRVYSFIFENNQPNGVQVTFVVKGNIYFSDNIFYGNPEKDGIAFIAMQDDDVEDSGNIYFGDPVYGTLQQMSGFMYAENDFHDVNLDASGSSIVRVNGNMTAGNQVVIDRDYGDSHTKLVVDFDDRISTGQLDMPGLPPNSDPGSGKYLVLSWRRVANP